MARKIVVIGGVATGPKAAARARRLDPEAQITIVEQGEIVSYAGCGMPFFVGGLIEDVSELRRTMAGALRDEGYFRATKDITVRTQTRADAIDRQRKEVTVLNLKTGDQEKLPYDKLVISTGSVPVVPNIEGRELNRVFCLANPKDAVAIRKAALARDVSRVAVIGAGAIGMEVVDAVAGLGVPVVLFELLPQVMPTFLDPEVAALLEKYVVSEGAEVHTSERVLRLEGDEQQNVRKVITDKGEVAVDLVVLAVGVRPNVQLARDAGLEIGPTGAIAVNEYLQTSDPHIYAGGDCVEVTNLVSGRKIYAPLGSTANKHGRVIGDNLVGRRETFAGVTGTTVLKVFEYNIGRTGLSEKQARDLGYEVITATASAPDTAHYYPEHHTILIKLVVDAKDGRVLGAQALGPGETVKRIDVVVTALTFGATVDQLAKLDLGYAPPFNTAIDILAHAANLIRNKRDGLAVAIAPDLVHEKLDQNDDFVLLDVRTPDEYGARHVDHSNVMLVPLGKLRERMAELPKDRPIVTVCQLGLRSYEAQTILAGAGFKDVKFMEGGFHAWPFELVTE